MIDDRERLRRYELAELDAFDYRRWRERNGLPAVRLVEVVLPAQQKVGGFGASNGTMGSAPVEGRPPTPRGYKTCHRVQRKIL